MSKAVRSPDFCVSRMSSLTGSPSCSPSRTRSEQARVTQGRLLKSCAIPPASRPVPSISEVPSPAAGLGRERLNAGFSVVGTATVGPPIRTRVHAGRRRARPVGLGRAEGRLAAHLTSSSGVFRSEITMQE